jgi:dTDP-4-dehydrorhamnose 3,5-epimerase
VPIKTTIEGLEIILNKVVKDTRGALCEMVPGGSANETVKNGIGNIYASIALNRQPRAGHYHLRNIENFFVVQGTALWAFRDYRKESSTFGKSYAVIVGYENVPRHGEIEQYTVENGTMAQVLVPAGVYHVYMPLTEKPTVVIAVASVPHSDDDYVRIDLETIPVIKDVLSRFPESK